MSIKARGPDIHYWGQLPRASAQMVDTARQAAGLLAVSHALARDMAALGIPAEGIHAHYTGLGRERFHPMERRAARALVSAIPEPGIRAEGLLIVTPGALIPINRSSPIRPRFSRFSHFWEA
jgi:hypothetical protein